MDHRLRRYAGRMVPRYTSYPTVPHFNAAIGPDDYATFLRRLDPRLPVSIYLHVPFCRELCWYCGCNMKLARRDLPIAEYAETLIAELDLVASHLPARMKVTHLHWGGGTPTTLSPRDIERAMLRLRAQFDFESGAELAVEVDPRTLTPAMVDCLGALGFTRVSFGVQEFDPTVQVAINRIQPPEMVSAAVDAVRAAGIAGVNFDLIYGLPHQSVAMLERTIDLCSGMRPDRIALFGYAHVPWKAKKQRLIDESALPGPEERMHQSTAAAAAIVARGYEAIGLDHFALPSDPLAAAARNGSLRRNFQGYTTDRADTLIGFGVTAIGRSASGYVQNLGETGAWSRAVAAGILPVGQGHRLSREDRIRGQVIESLMTCGAADLARVANASGGDLLRDVRPDLMQMAQDGIVELDGERLRVTEAGKPFVRIVAAAFDAYLGQRLAAHSIAV